MINLDDLTLEGDQIIALIHVKKEDESLIKQHSSYIGETEASVLNDEHYTTHYSYTIADV